MQLSESEARIERARARGAYRTPESLEEGRGLNPAALLGETVATYLLMVFGLGAIIAVNEAAGGSAPDSLAIALAWGFAVLIVVYAFGHVSGAHVNPAVTVALAAARKFPWPAVPAYVGAQMIGGVLASLTVWAMFGDDARESPLFLGITMPGDGYTVAAVFFTEVLITFILLLVVMATATDDRAESPAVGLGVGMTIATGIIVTGPISGASFNPMRSIAPMLVSGEFPAWLAYIAGPITGALLGALLYEYLIRPGEPPEPAGAIEEHERGEATIEAVR